MADIGEQEVIGAGWKGQLVVACIVSSAAFTGLYDLDGGAGEGVACGIPDGALYGPWLCLGPDPRCDEQKDECGKEELEAG
jgi:hypothetical protein